MANVMDKLAARARVRVYKPGPGSDDRASLCGEPMQKDLDQDGKERHFFVIPAHQADYINSAFRKYTVSEPYLPGVDNEALLGTLDKPEITGDFTCPVEGCGKTFTTERALNGHKSAHK